MTKTIEFISSDSGWAVFLRVVVFLAEIGLIVYFYLTYLKEEIINEASKNKESLVGQSKKESISRRKQVEEFFGSTSYSDEYYQYATEHKNIIIIERIPKKES